MTVLDDDMRRAMLPELILDAQRRTQRWLRRLFWLMVLVWVVWPPINGLGNAWATYHKAQKTAWWDCQGRQTDPEVITAVCGEQPW